MAPLRCCTFNCRGWNNGLLSLQGLIDSFDLCFIQEHWLHRDHLHKINNVGSEFLSVSVSGMDSGVLLQGRPFGGCLLIYRKSLVSFISPLVSCSNRFCGVKCVDSCGLSCLLVCVYMPARSSSTASSEYLNTLGELQGFITSQHFDVLLIAGDFNVDFDRSGPFHSLLIDFISDLNLFVCDLPFKNSVGFTYEGSQGFPPSWIDHVLCSASYYSLVTDVSSLRSGHILSDHFPLCFSLAVECSRARSSSSTPTTVNHTLDWSKATKIDIERFCAMVSKNITALPFYVRDCASPSCSSHSAFLDSYAQDLVDVLLVSARNCVPSRSV